MATKKLKIGVLFGGKSAEHEVSIQSAKFVIDGLDRAKYIVTPIKIPKDGKFAFDIVKKFDLVFPIFHGPYGEDGTMQGFLKLAGIPFVGPSVLGSALGLEKDVMKRLLRDAGIPIGKFISCNRSNVPSFAEAKKKLKVPIFIKPSNGGSSVGVTKVKNQSEFDTAVKSAFVYDDKIILEEMIKGREIECGVIGNEDPLASVLGEVVPPNGFYTYEAKYTDQGGAIYNIPVKLPKNIERNIRELAVKTYTTLFCEGMTRVDFFLKENGEVLVNEVNTIPGPVMFRKLWEATGVTYPDLLDLLVLYSLERFEKEQKLKTSFT